MSSALPDQEKTFQAALALDEEGRSSDAMKLLQPLVAERDNPRYLLAYAHCLVRAEGDWKEAVACLRPAVAFEPKYLEGPTRLFLADLLLRSGMKKEAIEQWRVVAEMQPDGTDYGAVPDEAIIMLRKHDV
jgi:predicted Zn-dependent protease